MHLRSDSFAGSFSCSGRRRISSLFPNDVRHVTGVSFSLRLAYRSVKHTLDQELLQVLFP